MNLLFICAGLESGQDAVGDYTVEMARRVADAGWDVSIVALADPHAEVSVEGLRAGCQTIRLPEKSSWRARWRQLADHVMKTKPDWISLQWVAFGYQEKGLPLLFGQHLRKAIGAVSLHIMCHEIWVGADGSGTIKGRLYSRLQRAVHEYCFATLKPALVHTHAEPYRRALGSIGVSANILPLGSNIHHDRHLGNQGTNGKAPDHAVNELAFIVFGNTPHEWNAREAIKVIAQACKRLDKNGLLCFVGKGGPGKDELQTLVSDGKEVGLKVQGLGFLEAERALEYMRHAHAGLATVPFALWQKSSAVAAMRTCGLPIIFTRFDGAWPEDWLPAWQKGFFKLTKENIEQMICDGAESELDLWESTALRFIDEIKSHTALKASDQSRAGIR